MSNIFIKLLEIFGIVAVRTKNVEWEVAVLAFVGFVIFVIAIYSPTDNPFR